MEIYIWGSRWRSRDRGEGVDLEMGSRCRAKDGREGVDVEISGVGGYLEMGGEGLDLETGE